MRCQRHARVRTRFFCAATLLALVIALPGIVLTSPVPARAGMAGTWSEPRKISTGTSEWAWFPDLAADAHGTVHVVWNGAYLQEERTPIGALFYTRLDERGWLAPNDVAVIWKGHALRASIATDQWGTAHLIYKGWGSLDQAPVLRGGWLGPEDIWHTSLAREQVGYATSWTRPTRLTRGTQGYFSDITVDGRGGVHVIWTESGHEGYGLYYANSADGGQTWSPRQALEGDASVWWYRAHLKVDLQDRIHAVWEVIPRSQSVDTPTFGNTIAAVYAISTDGGTTWSKTRLAQEQPNKPGPQQPAVAVDGRGDILLVYREPVTNRILYLLSADGAAWSEPRPVPGIRAGVHRPYDRYDAVVDSAGHLHLALIGIPEDSDWISLLHLEWDGRSWRRPNVVTAAPPNPVYQPTPTPAGGQGQREALASPPYPEYPRLAIGEGNRLHLVWFGGNRPTNDRDPIGIWYSTAQTPAPRVGPDPPPRPARPSATPAAAGQVSADLTRRRQDRAAPQPLPPAPDSAPPLDTIEEWRHHPAWPVVASVVAISPVLLALLVMVVWKITRRRW